MDTVRKRVLYYIAARRRPYLTFLVRHVFKNINNFFWIKTILEGNNLRSSYFLPGTLDKKEDFLQWKDNVHLHPIDLSIDDLQSEMSLTTLDPSLLENKQLRGLLVSGFYKVMKKVAELSNQNLVRNSDAFMSSGGKVDTEKQFAWIDDSIQEASAKFQLNY